MKKIGKNTKLYLIGMIIGGITLGITTVIADTIINSTSVSYKTTTVKAALDELYDIADFKEEVKDMLYPVGSIYISVSSTNPSDLFGGSWVSFGMGRTLLGVGSGVANNDNSWGTVPNSWCISCDTSERMGGEYEHTLTVNEMPYHTHRIVTGIWSNATYVASYHANVSEISGTFEAHDYGPRQIGGKYSPWTATGSGGSAPHNNMPPYITVYMWKRTA